MINGTKIVAVCTSRLHDPVTFDFVQHLNELLVEADCRLFVYHICTDYYWEESHISGDAAVYDLIDYSVVDAIIIMDEKIKNQSISRSIIKKSKLNSIPVIVLDNSFADCISICFDYKKGFEQIARHAIETHHPKRPHFMAGFEGNIFSEERLDVFKQVVTENGYDFSYDMVSYGMFWADPTRAAMEKILAGDVIPDCIICANDIMAINVCAVLQEHGYKVPDDVIVTGFDGIDEVYLTIPKITSVSCNYKYMANKCLELLQDLFAGKTVKMNHSIIPELIILESCGCEPDATTQFINYNSRFNTKFYRYQDDNKRLSDVADKMQECKSFDDIVKLLDYDKFDDTSIYIFKECMDEKKSTADLTTKSSPEKELLLLHHYEDKNIKRRDYTISEMNLITETLFYKKQPIIFNALFSLDKLLGYVCFHFTDTNITNCGKIGQIITFLSIGIARFSNRRNQEYLRRKLEEIYKYDTLTGLLNRKGFYQEFDQLKENMRAENGCVSLILADLDRLKFINDTYGHINGDKAIIMVAEALKSACGKEALSVRFGGDEMVAVIPHKIIFEEIEQRIYDALSILNHQSGLPYTVSTSLGFYDTSEPDEMDFDYLLSMADVKLYEVKKLKKEKNL